MSNSASDFLNAIKSMAQSVRNYVPTNFTGLHDTPTGYESYTDGFFVVPSGDRLVYDTVRFLDNVSDAPENQLVDGYLKLVEQNGNLVLQWSAGTTEGEVNYSIDGATHFTGLFDTPSGYKRGYYVRVKEDENKLEYISSTGLAEDTASEIANVIAHEKLLDFTGLGDTPTGYQTYTDGFFVVPSGDRLVYDKVKFLDNVSDAPISVVDGGFLKVTQDHPDDPFRLEWEKSIENFTGLSDTPSNYRSYTDGFFVVPSGDRLVYDTIRFLDNVSDAPSSVVDGGFLKVIQDNPDDPFRLEWVQPDSIKHFTGLLDTPAEYNSGYYLMSNKTGIEYQSLTGLADRLVDYGFNTGTPILDFTGLQDTPPNYPFKQYLESTTDGLQYINAHDLATTLGSIPKQYQDGVNFEGHLVNSGCDLYLVCNGQWIKYYSYNGILSSDSSDIPDCVNTVEELALYEQYKDYTTSEYGTNLFDEELNEPNPSTDFHNVCLFSSDSNSKVSIDETTYKWGIFNGDQTINLTALPGNGGGFSHWTGYGATFGNPNNQNTTTFVDKDLSITGVFNSVNTFDFANYDSNNAERILTNEAGYGHNFGTAVALYGNMLVATTYEQSQSDKHGDRQIYDTMPHRTYDGNRVGTTYIRQHLYTFIYNPNTKLWDQVGKQELTKTYSNYNCFSQYDRTDTWNEYGIQTMKLVGDTLFCGMPTHNQSIRTDVRGNTSSECVGTDTGSTWQTWRAGAVKILKWSNGSWVEYQTLQHPTTGALDPLGVQYTANDASYVHNMLSYTGFGHCIDVKEDKLLVVPYKWPYAGTWAQYTGKILIYTNNTNGSWELTDTIYADTPEKDDYFGVLSCFGANKNQIITRNDGVGRNDGPELAVYEKQNDGTWMQVMTQPFSINLGNYDESQMEQELFFVDGSLYVKYSIATSHRLYKIDTSKSTWTLGDYIELPAKNQLDNGGNATEYWTVRSVSINGGVIASSAITDNNIFLRAGTVYINRL